MIGFFFFKLFANLSSYPLLLSVVASEPRQPQDPPAGCSKQCGVGWPGSVSLQRTEVITGRAGRQGACSAQIYSPAVGKGDPDVLLAQIGTRSEEEGVAAPGRGVRKEEIVVPNRGCGAQKEAAAFPSRNGRGGGGGGGGESGEGGGGWAPAASKGAPGVWPQAHRASEGRGARRRSSKGKAKPGCTLSHSPWFTPLQPPGHRLVVFP